MDKTLSTDSGDTQQEALDIPGYHRSKGVAERILGGMLLLAAAPVIGLIVTVVRCTSSGKGIYKQTRVGKDGHEFMIYKIRTMCDNAESSGRAQWATPGDSRITRVGRVLRYLHLDELPQLANVAHGHMSLIGPRPERPEFVAVLEQRVPNYLDRLTILPGVTGLAQINLPADDSLESVRQKVILDREYIKTASMTLDLRIFFCTLLRMTGFSHGVAPWLFGVECNPHADKNAVDDFCDTSELAAPPVGTEVNIPSLVAASLVLNTPAIDIPFKPAPLAYTTKKKEVGVSQSDADYQETTPVPRRPR